MGSPPAALAPRGVAAARSLRLSPVTPLPECIAVGRGTAVFLDGLCSHPSGPLAGLSVSVDGVEHPVLGAGMPPPGAYEGSDYWWAIVPFAAVARPQLLRLRLHARLAGGGEATGDLGMVELHPWVDVGEPAQAPRSRAVDAAEHRRPSIAICMATWEPPIDLFRRQVESIREQTYDNWVCVISDDHSSPERLRQMEEVLGDDERFSISRSGRRLGFYGNFERALALAPPDVDLVAMCDQDDRWYPEKLEALEAALRPGVQLAYSDMRIVTRAGEVRFDTYWSYRRNNHTNFGSLLMANTVTGAASLFRRSLLDYVLPFPPRYEANYHDHWVALVAMAMGQVAYVDRPLYDYVQHEGAVLGHARANGILNGGAAVRNGPRGARARIRSLRVPRGLRHLYFTHYCGTMLTALIAEQRCGPDMRPAKRRTLRRFAHPSRAIGWLALRSPRRWVGRTETLRREQALLGGLAWRRYAELRKRWASRRGMPAPPAEPRVTLGGPQREAAVSASAGANGTGAPGAPHTLTPILVDYFTRDGSTLLMRLLGTSPQVAVEDQYPYERKYFNYLWRWSRLLDRGQWPSESWSPSSLASITQERHVPLLGPPPWHPRSLIESPAGEPAMSRRCFDLAWAEFSARAARASAGPNGDPADVRLYAEKHLDTYLLDRAELPPIELLVLLRDPRDTYVSILAFNRKRGTAAFGRGRAASDREHLDQLIARQRERLRWIAGLLADEDPAIVRYDELVLDTPALARRLEAQLDIELDPAAAVEDAQMRRAHVSAASPEASIGRWRHELDPEVVEVFRSELGDELAAVGFEA